MKKNKEKEQKHQYKQVRVTWVDSIIGESAWTLEPDFEDEEPAKVTTLGFIVAEDERHLTIAQNLIHEPSTQFSNIITIPKCSITKTEEL